jgi:alpha-glucosidase (family GH31 glycosyl hydrolase)
VRSDPPAAWRTIGDPLVWEHPRQWLLGDDLLVSPVTEPGATRWPAYLPAGAWVDAWTGTPYDGGTVVTTDVPIDVVPVFVRAEAWDALAEVFDPAR